MSGYVVYVANIITSDQRPTNEKVLKFGNEESVKKRGVEIQ